MEKNYYKLKKAVKFLNSELKTNLDRSDVMEMAARGEFNLCVPFDGNVTEFKYSHPDPVRASAFLFKLKNALIKIPPESINLRGGIVHIIPIEIIEVIANTDYKAPHPYYGGGCENLPATKPGYFYGTYTPDHENAGKIKFAAFEANSDDAVIPAQDLLDFIRRIKEPKQPIQQTTTSITKAEMDGNAFEEELAALFDPVPVEALETMFSAGGEWKKWIERAKRNGLSTAKDGRALFNPYKAGLWLVRKGVIGWDDERVIRVLSKKLPPRSKDKAHLLTGDIG